eukprot:scaffold234252_cov34-Attheya_sp.AAC.1
MVEPWGYLEQHTVSPLVNEKEFRVEAPCALEDESGRVELQGEALQEGRPYPTGVVVAVHGTVQPGTGIFKVHQIFAPTLSQHPPPFDSATSKKHESLVNNPDACVLLVSGLECANPSQDGSLARDLLLSYLTGHLDTIQDPNDGDDNNNMRARAHHVGRVIVAGGLLCANHVVGSHNVMDNAAAGNHSMRSPKEALVDLDAFLGQVGAAGIPVDVIPGKYDPTNANWPQRPLHKSLLPVSCRSSSGNRNNSNNGGNGTVLCTPNPYEAKLTLSSNKSNKSKTNPHQHQQILMVGNDGAAIQDVRQVLGGKQQNNNDEEIATATATATELEALKATFSFSHTCPTSPDSLGAMPLVDGTDPHVLTERPHLYFAGNCTQFATCT